MDSPSRFQIYQTFRPVKNEVFCSYLTLMREEILEAISPGFIRSGAINNVNKEKYKEDYIHHLVLYGIHRSFLKTQSQESFRSPQWVLKTPRRKSGGFKFGALCGRSEVKEPGFVVHPSIIITRSRWSSYRFIRPSISFLRSCIFVLFLNFSVYL